MTDVGTAMMTTHSAHLVVILSVVIAIIASYTALNLSGRLTVAQGRARTVFWLVGGAIAIGIGIWSMQFIVMVAYHLPMPMTYNLPVILVSMAVAVVASGVALFVNLLSDPSVAGIVTTYCDITERKWAESALQKAYEELEIKVEQRTNELRNANEQLQSEIVERQRAEEALGRQQAFLRNVIDTNPNCIFVKDEDEKYTLVNQTTADLFGTTIEDLIGKTNADFNVNQEEVEQFLCDDREVMETLREKLIPEETLTDATGKVRWFQTIKKPLISSNSKARQVLGVSTDITERKRAEEDLRKSEARNRALLNAIPDLILRINKDGTYLDFKRARDFGLLVPDSELIGKSEYDLLSPALAQLRMHYVKQALSTGDIQIFEYQLLLNGNIRDEEARIVISGEDEVLLIIRDITERKQAVEALRESQQMLQSVLNNIPQFVFWKDRNSVFLGCNHNFAQLAGVGNPENIVGKTDYDLPWKEEEANFFRECDSQVMETDTPAYHIIEPLLQASGEQAWLDTNKVPLHDSMGNVVGILGTFEDITERKRAQEALQKANEELEIRVEERTTELRNANEQLLVEITERKQVEAEIKKLNEDLKRRAVELEAANKELEAFSYSVSHDLRAPLRAINGFSRILLKEYAPQLNPEASRYLQMVRDNAQQMGCLVDDLLTFSRLGRSPLKKHPVAPTELVRQALANLREEQQGRHIEMSISDLPVCQADSALLKQVWINLLANALKFTRQRQVTRIEAGYQQTDSDRIYFVKDNGVGFDMQYIHKLFRVFQRLHRAEEYEGTGVGLAIVQRIIHRHGGRVWAEAEVNKGATFYFTLGRDIPHDGDSGRNIVSGRQP